jgi:hypothetical protein
MLDNFIKYYSKAKMMQELKFQGGNWTESDIADDLIWNVPIYDVVNRRFAAFSSLPEAIIYRDKDPKGNGKYFEMLDDRLTTDNFIRMCYLFRLCGSGINYIPKEKNQSPFGTHGFGNFWIADELRRGWALHEDWLNFLPEKGFCDVKGYMLPMINGGLRNFIIKDSMKLVTYLIDFVYKSDKKVGIKSVVDKGNDWLLNNGYKRQNFVLTAFAMDLAEYIPDNVDRDSDVYVGTNAKKCLKLILPKMKTDEALRYLCDITGGFSKPYDMEDVACDFIRYIENFQSEAHIRSNNNIVFKNSLMS